jgi:hypothetical protein
MSARRLLCVVVVVVMAAVSASAGDNEKKSKAKWTRAPGAFRGVKFGATKEDAEAILGRLRCRKAGAVLPERVPTGAETAEALPPHVSCTADDKSKEFRAGGKVLAATYLFDENRFVGVRFGRMAGANPSTTMKWAEVLAQFTTEYGDPTEQNTNRHQGTAWEETQTWDAKQNRSVSKSYPMRFDFERTCALWEDPAVDLTLCSYRDLFAYGRLDTDAWAAKVAQWRREQMESGTYKRR